MEMVNGIPERFLDACLEVYKGQSVDSPQICHYKFRVNEAYTEPEVVSGGTTQFCTKHPGIGLRPQGQGQDTNPDNGPGRPERS